MNIITFVVFSSTLVVSLRIQSEEIGAVDRSIEYFKNRNNDKNPVNQSTIPDWYFPNYIETDDLEPDPAQADGLRLFEDPSRDILLVHIGKSGGSAWRCFLGEQWCRVIPNEHHVVEHSVRDSVVAKHIGGVVHMHPITTQEFANWLIVLRDPLVRIASAYNYHKVFATRNSRYNSFHLLRKFFECSEWEFSKAVKSLQAPHGDACGDAARACFAGDASCGTSNHHFWFNYRYYAKPILERAKEGDPAKRVSVIRFEHMWPDFAAENKLYKGEFVPTHDAWEASKTREEVTSLSSSERRALCQVLHDEIYFYTELLKLAENLTPQDIQESEHEIRAWCN